MFLCMQIFGVLDEKDIADAVSALRCVSGVLHVSAESCSGQVDVWYEGTHLDASTLLGAVQHSGDSGLAVVVTV